MDNNVYWIDKKRTYSRELSEVVQKKMLKNSTFSLISENIHREVKETCPANFKKIWTFLMHINYIFNNCYVPYFSSLVFSIAPLCQGDLGAEK